MICGISDGPPSRQIGANHFGVETGQWQEDVFFDGLEANDQMRPETDGATELRPNQPNLERLQTGHFQSETFSYETI